MVKKIVNIQAKSTGRQNDIFTYFKNNNIPILYEWCYEKLDAHFIQVKRFCLDITIFLQLIPVR